MNCSFSLRQQHVISWWKLYFAPQVLQCWNTYPLISSIFNFEDVLFKMSYAVDTLPTYLDYLKTKDDTHLNIFHVATSECVKIGQNIHNKIVYCSSYLERDLTSMTVSNIRYCESHLLYRVSWYLLKLMRRRVSAWWKYSVVLCKFSLLAHFGTQKMVT